MAILETVLIFLYLMLGVFLLKSNMRIIYGVFAVSGFFFLRISLCPSCPLYKGNCTSRWNEIGRLFRIKEKEKILFRSFTKVATIYWIFVFMFPLIIIPARESLFLFILLPIVVLQVIRCKKCPVRNRCFFGSFVRKEK
ncbi:hypothetical protein [Desulfurobacterium indicum]|uniref:Uncharacterized protein n=1 Tax=Desulfurobacterium indicum TaxID=1914305 RepID=A0A1R1MK14_9BACT|nr:hypothetical protein [Desulfurobacterium indicum]OMH40147.1 hypothetical protein BLW93_06755 [Desulfurobacterium indicum]